jgi:hypothetical protein
MNWCQMTICEQLGNVGSEVGRAVKWRDKNNIMLMKQSLGRAFDLLDLTIADPRWQNHRQKELKIVREVLADMIFGDKKYGAHPESLEKYFYHFAVAARNK